ncbi:hypothetical protein [Burkholderia cenocepacia]|uniref:hypothetical protein n=1 Tax=Burkholderia cenocepacia TaxID=95486 RepID=UPI002865A3BD|nr:hypothetical protein [Burkholderia cenocepacia]MDR8071882.1 hypothetical protein [Burkholderia cenocepacia]
MKMGKSSLRSLVDKWLGPTPARPLHVSRFGRTRDGIRYVCVEVLPLTGPLTIAFFYHEDGSWNVFPPATNHRAFAVSAGVNALA